MAPCQRPRSAPLLGEAGEGSCSPVRTCSEQYSRCAPHMHSNSDLMYYALKHGLID